MNGLLIVLVLGPNNALNCRSLRSLDVQKLRFWPPVSLIVRGCPIVFNRDVEKIMAAPWSYPGLIHREPNSLLLSFSIHDSIRTWSSWYVFMSNMQFFVRRIEWPKGEDRFPILAAGPTTFGSEVVIPKAVAESLIDSALNIVGSNSTRTPAELTIDGIYFSIAIWRNGESAEVSWAHGLKGNSELNECLSNAEAVVGRFLPKSSAKTVQGAL
jgi:hypothetical protein